MLVLGVDSTTARESVALVRGERLLGEVHLDTADVASRRLLPAAAFLLEAAGVKPEQLDGFAVAVGPGSFTGLRVGIATVQGLALGTGRPCVGIASLDALGRQAAGVGAPVAALVDALRGEVYAGLYDERGARLGELLREAPAAFVARAPASALFAGDGAERYRDAILALRPGARFAPAPAFLGAALARLGIERLRAGDGVPPEELRPLYLREAHIRPQPAAAHAEKR